MTSAVERRELLKEVWREASTCTKCPLSETRQTVVFGAGNADADLMFVGEAPGANEDRGGLPFIGQAGRLLDRLLEEVGLERGDVFIANVLKCRPPNNRDPRPTEIETCRDYLHRQVELIEPKVICTLGNFSTKLLRDDPTGISKVHGSPEVRRARQPRRHDPADLPPGRRALHAQHARHAAGRLRPAAGPARRAAAAAAGAGGVRAGPRARARSGAGGGDLAGGRAHAGGAAGALSSEPEPVVHQDQLGLF